MPRRYSQKLVLDKLNSTLATQQQQRRKTQRISDSEHSSVDSDEEDADAATLEKGPTRQLLENTAHYSHPALNQGLGQNTNLVAFPSCAFTVPLPLYVANQTTPIVEPCTRRPAMQEDWMRQLHLYKSQYLRETKRQKQRDKKQKAKIYNCHLFDLAEHIATQENSYFRDSYDYYYTGGNLNLLNYGVAGEQPKTLALHVTGQKLNRLHCSQVGAEAEQWRPLHSETLEGLSSEIFELLPVDSFRVNHGNMFLARMLNEIAIYELKQAQVMEDNVDDEQQSKYELNLQSKYNSQEGYFVSVAQAVKQLNTLAIACQDRSVRFLDLVTQQDISKHEICVVKGVVQKRNIWAQLRAWQEHCFYYACQSVLLTIDMRCANQAINPLFASSVHSQHCENFSCLGRSRNEHLLYLASNHKLHCLDMRCMGKKITDRAVVTWTHQMSYPPTFMDALAHEGSEFVALGSALPSDQRICELKGVLAESLTEISSPALPYAPPHLDEALTAARLQGCCIDIYADLKERIKGCHTGLKLHRLENTTDNAFAQLLIANSLGDIYCQRVTQRLKLEMQQEQRTGPHTSEALDYYADLVEKCVSRTLRCTDVKSMSVLREIMRTEPADAVEPEKPLIIEDVKIDYGFSDSDVESIEEKSVASSDEQSTASQREATVNEKEATASEKEAAVSHKEAAASQKKAAVDQKKAVKSQKEAAANQKEAAANQKEAANSQKEDIKDLTQEEQDTKPKKKKAVHRGPWQKSAFQLSTYTDVISTRMLNIWDIDEFELTRDVQIDMIDEKLKKQQPETTATVDRLSDWLQQVSDKPDEDTTEDKSELVPGTNLTKHFDAKNADYKDYETIDIETKSELHNSFSFKRQHSILEPDEFTIIESRPNPPAKRAKTKYTMGF